MDETKMNNKERALWQMPNSGHHNAKINDYGRDKNRAHLLHRWRQSRR